MSDLAQVQPPDQVRRRDGASIIEAVISKGDLAKLTPLERTQYYNEVCRSVGLNPFTRPFEYISLGGKLVLYARRECTDQLRHMHGVSVEIAATESVGDLYVVRARATNASGKSDEDLGAVSVKGLTGEALANAMMKATTKAKRRVTLSICGLGFLDESENEGIPHAERSAPADTRARLDQFAGVPPSAPDLVDTDTGEIFDWDRLNRDAREAARRGTQILRDHLRSLPPEARELLHELIGTATDPGELLLLARQADADATRERLRIAEATDPPAGVPPSERLPPRPDAAAPGPSAAWAEPAGGHPTDAAPAESGAAATSTGLSRGPSSTGERADAPPPATHRWSVPRRPAARDWELFEDWVGGKLEDGVPGGALRVDNEHALRLLKEADPARYDEVQERLTEARS